MMGKKCTVNKIASRKSGGYSLIELVLAIVILGSLASAVAANLDFSTATTMSAAHNTLENAIREAQSFSMYQKPGYTIKMDTDIGLQDRYITKDVDGNVIPRMVGLAVADDGTTYDGVLLAEGTHIRPTLDITFDQLGRPGTNGTLWTDSKEFEVYSYSDPDAPDEDQTISSGTVHVEKNTGAIWTVTP
ncbi:MAG: type II secretion system protein [Magnetococcales bacterium]|nr:type II secretion system protein [Magnetococcales bacterium]